MGWGEKKPQQTPYLQLASNILREAREELVRADGKASLLLAATGIIIGALLAAFLAGTWHPSKLKDCVEWLWWVGTAVGSLGTLALAAAVFPRTKYRSNRRPGIVAYFGDVVGLSSEELQRGLEGTARNEGSACLDQVKAISFVVDKKYRWIQTGMVLLGVSALCCVLAVLIDGWM
ncbi:MULTISPECIES: Pycsar system effector family protein [unclassified Pseudarthrobacter]|uniref:Pycsar system effector family protein n=1 Tax=unclassified Pseudarthrobacter TaxID=2647000 RepID=UPI003076C5F0